MRRCNPRDRLIGRALGAALLSLLPGAVLAQAPIAAPGAPVTQNFDALANTGTASTLPTGWALLESGTNANALYTAGTGSSNSGDTYSFGPASGSDRAFGGLLSGSLIPVIGAQFQNVTGGTITSLDIAYTGEQWRLGTAGRTDRIDFQYSLDATSLSTGTWTDVNPLDFVAPTSAGALGALDGNAAANRTAISATISSLAISNGATVWIRWTDFNATGADDGLAVDDFSLTAQGAGSGTPVLSINDISLAEGDSGTTVVRYTISLSQPAGASGVSFDIATADNTATTADNDYVAAAATGQTIPAGSSSTSFDVTINGDTTVEPNETYFVNVTNVTGANVGDGQGLGTIANDDVVLTPIHQIQGAGTSSPLAGQIVTTRGIVTALVSNGFFLQTPDAEADADPATSQALFVFTSTAPTAARGDLVQVTGTVVEFAPSTDPFQRPLTELAGPTVTVLGTGNPLPAPIDLSLAPPMPGGGIDQLERHEAMRVAIPLLTVVAPTDGNVSEPNATATSDGVFHGVITGSAGRPLRETGIEAPEDVPAGSGVSIPPVPRFDGNPERIRVHSARQTGATPIDVDTGAVVNNLVGVLDYAFRSYTLATDPGLAPMLMSGVLPREVAAATAREFTVAAYNVERFFDATNDPAISEPVLTALAFDTRLSKLSQAVRLFLGSPDIIALSEVENLATLQAIAARINSDAGAANPQYRAFLVEGLDVGGIDVGFLVRSAEVAAGRPRVADPAVTQFGGAGTTLRCPDSPPGTPGAPNPGVLNDRPPLLLTATINAANGASYPVTVIANHLRSLNDVNSGNAATGNDACFGTVGNRVREKRQQQAEFLAQLVQSRQVANPNERLVLVGDFNAFEFNDGYADVIGTIAGTKAGNDATVVGNDTEDLVEPNLTNLIALLAPAERYGYVFGGNAQNLDHGLVNNAVIASSTAQRLEHARINADFNETLRAGAATPLRLSDHDPLVVFIAPKAFATADLGVSLADAPDPVAAGAALTYQLSLANAGPDAAADASVSLALPAATTFTSLTAPPGFACSTPTAGATGTVACTIAALTAGTSASINVTATAAPDSSGTLLTALATSSAASTDPVHNNNTASATTQVLPRADLSVTLGAAPDPVAVGGTLTYTLGVANAGPNDASAVSVVLPLPAGTTFASSGAPAGWTCVAPEVGAIGTVTCSIPALAREAQATLSVTTTVGITAAGATLQASATASTTTTDPVPGNDSASTSSTVTPIADLAIAAVDSPDPVAVGALLTYTVTVSNLGPNAAAAVVVTLPLAASVTLESVTAPSGYTCAPPANGSIACSGAALANGASGVFMLTVRTRAPAGGSALAFAPTVSAATSDPVAGNNRIEISTAVGAAANDVFADGFE